MAYEYAALPKKEIYELINRAKNGDEEAKTIIVKNNTGLVKSIAARFTKRGYELEDLMQTGYVGLLKAVIRFDTSFDVMFSTYAVPVIVGEIRRFIRDDNKIKVSRKLKYDIAELTSIREKFYTENGRYPRISELAGMLNTDKNEIMYIMTAADSLSGFESFDNPDSPAAITELMNDDDEEEKRKIDMILLKNEIGNLDERERQIIIMRYFMDMTQSDIAKKLKISQVQVSRMEKRVLKRLRQKIER